MPVDTPGPADPLLRKIFGSDDPVSVALRDAPVVEPYPDEVEALDRHRRSPGKGISTEQLLSEEPARLMRNILGPNLPPRLTSRETAELLRLTMRGLETRRRRKLAPLPIGGTPRRPLYDRDEVLGLAGYQ